MRSKDPGRDAARADDPASPLDRADGLAAIGAGAKGG
jgi:hypothetical protein